MGVVHAKQVPEAESTSSWKPFNQVPARVDKIHFDGVQRTKDDVLLYVVSDLLQAQNFQELVLRAHGVRQHLESLNSFKSIDIILETSKGPESTENGFEVIFDIKERQRVAGNVNVQVGNNEGNLLLQCLLPNVLGRGESVQAEYQYGKKTLGFNIKSTKPIFSWVNPTVNQLVFSQTSDYPWSGFEERLKGLAAELIFESSPQVLHTLRWEGVWRNLACSSHMTPFLIREEAGHSVKSSIKHILSMDQRDDPCLPLRGCFFRLYQEYAGLGGNVSFLKHEVQYQVNKSIFGNLVLQATLMGGLVRSLLSDRAVRINDRFFLGGPLSLRGFLMQGVGPHIQNYSVGAEAYWACGLHVYTPLPFRPLQHVLDKICRLHGFFNVGNIDNFPFTDDYHSNIILLLSRLRCSCGVGVALSVGGLARFELNYCVPISSEPGDKLRKGLQFGIGVNFL